MANVTLSIGGRAYTLACADGEEDHLDKLGQLIDEKAAASGAIGQTETRMLLFASIMMADELLTLRKNAVTSFDAPANSSTPSQSLSPELTERLAAIADSVENLASLLEDQVTTD